MADNVTYNQIGVRVSQDERELIEAEAEREHLSMSSLVRSIVLKEITARMKDRKVEARAA